MYDALEGEGFDNARRKHKLSKRVRQTSTIVSLAIILALLIALLAVVMSGAATCQIKPAPAPTIIYQGTHADGQNFTNMCAGALSPGDAGAVRARDLGVPFTGVPGAHNAVTDVAGVLVGHSTLICGQGALVVGQGPVRTGVTAILPRGIGGAPVTAGFYSLSGNGEATGVHYLLETGCLIGPLLITNTASVGTVHQSVIQYSNALLDASPQFAHWFDLLPVVSETWDGDLNDINGLHVQLPHVQQAIEGARSGPVAEGSVGGGTGMRAFGWKAGAGTASRRLRVAGSDYLLGVYVQANFGSREQLLVAGVPVGLETADVLLPVINSDDPAGKQAARRRRDGSCVVVVATDAPLSATQCNRLAKRAALGYSRTGGTGHASSGDLFFAFATGAQCTTADFTDDRQPDDTDFLPMDAFFDAAVAATEEAIVNAMVAAANMTGINDNTIYALPHPLLQSILRKYNRLVDV